MRGARPDAECPRCNHKQPPSDSPIVTCSTCGLAFPPRELQRSSKIKRPKSDALALPQPAELKIRTHGEELSYVVSEFPFEGWISTGALVLLALFLWGSDVVLLHKVGYTVFMAALSAWALWRSRKKSLVRLDRNHLRGPTHSLLLADIQRVDADCGRLAATDRYGKSHEIVMTSDHVAAFIADDLARRLGYSD